MAKMQERKRDEQYRVYIGDSLHLILRSLGAQTKAYSEILYPEPVDNRTPEEIARERAEKLGLKIVS